MNGYVGLLNAVLLAQHNEVVALVKDLMNFQNSILVISCLIFGFVVHPPTG